jgi:hypothetical protein
MDKSIFKGTITSIQPRIRLTRSFDEASHTYLGYAIKITGTIDNQETTFSIGIGKAAQAKFNFKVNDIISGECLPVPDPDMEPVDFYKVSKLAKVAEGEQGSLSAPWELVPPELEVYRERGHRRLAARTYDSKCSSCMWGARMPVEIIVDNWNPSIHLVFLVMNMEKRLRSLLLPILEVLENMISMLKIIKNRALIGA